MIQTGARPKHPALTDPDTGLANRLHFETVFSVVFAAGHRGIPVAVMLLELEGLHEWEARTPPAVVTRELQAWGTLLDGAVRQVDLVARMEPERFAVVLLDCNLAGGRLVADRLDTLASGFRHRTGVGVSMGVAVFSREMAKPGELLDAAQRALARARARGRNQIEVGG